MLGVIVAFTFTPYMAKFIFTIFILYLIYKLIFDFILPVYKTTRRVKQKMNQMQQQQQDFMRQQEQGNAQPPHTHIHSEKDKGDYIDYEEVK